MPTGRLKKKASTALLDVSLPPSIHALLTAYFCPDGSTLVRGTADQVAQAAIAAIEAGVDAPMLSVFAGLSGSLNPFEMEAMLRDLMKELGVVVDDLERVTRADIKPPVIEDVVEPVSRSMYLFELSNGPGGASLAHVHACATIPELKRILAYYFEVHTNITMGYSDALMAVWVVQRGKVVSHIDVRPYVDAGVLDWRRLRKAIPELEGKRAGKGDLLAIDVAGFEGVSGSYLPFGESGPLELRYGWNDLQFDEAAPDDWPG